MSHWTPPTREPPEAVVREQMKAIKQAKGQAMTDIVKGMAIAGWHKGNPVLKNHLQCFPETQAEEEAKMRAALMWLADNVSDEMVQAYRNERESVIRNEWFPSLAEAKTLSAAIRAAAGGEP